MIKPINRWIVARLSQSAIEDVLFFDLDRVVENYVWWDLMPMKDIITDVCWLSVMDRIENSIRIQIGDPDA